MVRSTQIDPNEIQLDHIPKDKNMEGQIAWEEGNLAPLEVVEEHVIVAPQARKNNGEFELTRARRLDVRQHTEGVTFPTTKMGPEGEAPTNQQTTLSPV